MTSALCTFAGVFLFVAFLPTTRAGDPLDDADTPAARQARLDYLKSRAAECELFKEGDCKSPLVLSKEALLRYTNPVRGIKLSDGATFLWLDGERPLAVASWSLRGAGNVWREFTSLTDKPLACTRDDVEIWSPKTGGLLDQQLLDAPAPLPSATRRLGQMRDLARRFSAIVYLPPDDTVATELRLLSQPIHRYKDETARVLDGALFSFAEATDPEALLLLEARRSEPEGDYQWRYTMARMTSVRMIIRLDGKERWSLPNFWRNPRSLNDPYFESGDGKYSVEE
jgi:hypothetical protein